MPIRSKLKKLTKGLHHSGADAEGDARMASSPSASSSHSSSMFPSATSPTTPSMPAEAAAAATMSPPESQDHPTTAAGDSEDAMMLDGHGDGATVEPENLRGGGQVMTRAENGERGARTQTNAGQSAGGQGGQEVLDEKEPGYLWRNPKAMEEMQKSMDAVLDKGFSLSEFPTLATTMGSC